MQNYRFLALVLAAFPLAIDCAIAQAASALRAEVEPVVRAYVEAHNRGDAAAIADAYIQQPGVTSVGDGRIIRGWDRIREYYDQLDELTTAGGRLQIRVSSFDVVPLGPGYALVIASYGLTAALEATEVRQRGVMTLVLQKIGGQWKVIHDHSSTRAEATETTATPSPPLAPAAAAAVGPAAVPIADGSAIEVPAQQYVKYTFQLPARLCTVSGRAVGVSGGNKDFEAILFTDDDLRNWSAGLQANAQWQSGRVAVANIQTELTGPGTFHLVISNAFSLTTPKTVQVWAQAQC